MVMQQPHTLEREPRSNRSYIRPVTHLTEMAAYTTFGSLLAAVRQNAHMAQEESVFDFKTDIEARTVLQQVVSKRLSHHAIRMIDALSISSMAIPFPLLDEICPQAELAFDELVRCSLVDRDLIASRRAAVLPLVREARVQAIVEDGRQEAVEQQVIHLYKTWLENLQEFHSDQEKSGLVSELIALYIKHRRLLDAAHLSIMYGWLCALFGHVPRLLRVYEEIVRQYHWRADAKKVRRL